MTLELVPEEATLPLDLWLWPLAATPDHRAALAAHLTPAEHAHAAAFHRDADRAQFELSRGRLREILAGALGCAADAVPLSQGPHGKPALAEGAKGQGPAFNLAHAGGWAALVTGPHGLALGIDIEPFRMIEPEIATRFFSSAEQAELAALPEDQWQAGFFNAWTRKEALLKALGAGLSRPLDSFDVTLTPGAPARLTRLAGAVADRWQLIPLALRPDFPGCIALRSSARAELSIREGTLPLPG